MFIKNNRIKLTIIGLVACVGLAGGVLYFWNGSNDNNDANKAPTETIKYDPPTREERQAGDEQKRANDKEEEAEQPSNTGATVIITDSTQYVSTVEIRAYISNVTENGGTCTTSLTKQGAATVTRATTAFLDASSTQCGAIDIPRSAFASVGTWSGTIRYDSPAHTGTSNPFKVIVQ